MPLSDSFKALYGPWAVVSGASSGLGAEFARQLAAAGLSVAIVARRADRLEEVSREIAAAHPAGQVKVIAADIATDAGIQAVADGTASLDVGLFVNNAGVEAVGAFLALDVAASRRLIDVNVSACTALAHLFGRRLVDRTRADGGGEKRGAIIMTSSIASSASPFMAAYGASKAFVTALALAMRTELEPDRVDVLAFEPGPVKTEMFAREEEEFDAAAMGFDPMPTEECVGPALQALEQRRARVTPGLKSTIMKAVMGIMPEGFVLSTLASMFRKNMKKPKLIEYEGK